LSQSYAPYHRLDPLLRETSHTLLKQRVLKQDYLSDEGLRISIVGSGEFTHPEYEKVIQRYGSEPFHICYCCWLKALGVKEKNE